MIDGYDEGWLSRWVDSARRSGDPARNACPATSSPTSDVSRISVQLSSPIAFELYPRIRAGEWSYDYHWRPERGVSVEYVTLRDV